MAVPQDNDGAPIMDDDLYMPIEWDTFKHGVGLAVIDNQHKFLVSVVNRLCAKRRGSTGLDVAAADIGATFNRATLHRRQAPMSDRRFDDRLQKGKEKETITPEVEDLVTYCARHLTAEEHLLETYNYADRAAHVQEHQTFVREVHRAHSLMESYNMEEADFARLVTFLKSWLVDHIPKDRRFAPLLVDKDVGA